MTNKILSDELLRKLDRVLSKPHEQITTEEIEALADDLERENRWHDMLIARRPGPKN